MPAAPALPPLELQPLLPPDRVPAAALLSRAFAESPVYVAVLSQLKGEAYLPALQRIKQGFVNAALHHGACRVARVEGGLAAVALVVPPGGYPFSVADELRQSLGCATTGPTAIARFLRISAYLRQRHLAEPHYYLYAIGVEPQFQGRGIGKRMLAELNAQADAAGMPCFLETEKAINVRLYQSAGYEVRTQEDLPGFPQLPMWTMHRPPQGGMALRMDSTSGRSR